MFDPVTAIAVSGAVGAGAGLLGAKEQSKAADKAAQSSLQATQESNRLQKEMFDINRKDMEPWRDVGQGALYSIADLMGIDTYRNMERPNPDYRPGYTVTNGGGGGTVRKILGNTIGGKLFMGKQTNTEVPAVGNPTITERMQNPRSDRFGYLTKPFDYTNWRDPGYDFRFGEGVRALDRSAASRGRLFSGGYDRELSRYGQDYGSNEFANAYGRWKDYGDTLYNRYAGLSGTGQTATSQIGQYGTNTAANMANTLMSGNNAAARAYQDAATARASGYANMANAGNSAVNNYLFYSMMKGKVA